MQLLSKHLCLFISIRFFIFWLAILSYSSIHAQTQIGSDIDGESTSDRSGHALSLSADGRIVAIGAPNNFENGSNSGQVRVYEQVAGTWTQLGRDIDGLSANEGIGNALSLSADGKTVAVGGPYANSNTGLVRVYRYSSGVWTQVGSDIEGDTLGDTFGFSVGLSARGNILAVGTYVPSKGAGQVRMYENASGTWTPIGTPIIGEAENDWSGYALSLSDDGKRVAIGSPLNSASGGNAGQVRVFENVAGTWSQLGDNINGEVAGDLSGVSLSLSGNGSVVAIGAYSNDGNGSSAGHVRVYENISGTWTQIGADLDGEAMNDQSGFSVSTNLDGSVVVIGAPRNTGSTGHIRVFQNLTGTWTQIGEDIDGASVNNQFGHAVSISDDGSVVAGGATLINSRTGHTRVYRTGLPYTATDFVSFSLTEQASGANINIFDHTVDITVTPGSDLANLTPSFTISDGASASVSGTAQESGVTTLDFTTPVTYTLTAEDGITQQTWTVSVAQGANTATDFTSFSFPQQTGPATIDPTEHTISIEVLNRADRSTLISTFTLSDGASAKVASTEQISGTTANDFSLPLTYTITAEDETTTQDWTVTVTLRRMIGDAIAGSAAHDESGNAVGISADGRVVAIGSFANSDGGNKAGHVRIYRNLAGAWTQWGEAIVGEEINDQSGWSVSLSADGTRVAIGANQNDGTDEDAGHIRVFENQEGEWVQLGEDIDGEAKKDGAGISVSLSANGSIVAFGAFLNDQNGENAGHVRVFQFEENAWVQLGNDIDGEAAGDNAGNSISLSADGQVIAIGSPGHNGNGERSGQVRVFKYSANEWTLIHSALLGASAGDQFGNAVSLSASGNVIAIGAPEHSGAGFGAGLVQVFEKKADSWVKVGSDINGETAGDLAGSSVSLSANGQVVTLGAPFADGNGTNAGLVRIFQNIAGTWVPTGERIQGDSATNRLGTAVSTNREGTVVAIGAPLNNDMGTNSGHVQVWETGVPLIYTDFFTFSLAEQVQQAKIDEENHTIEVEVVFGTDVTRLVPHFTLSYGATAKANGEDKLSGETSTDFTSPVVYSLTAGDKSTTQDWTVTVSVAPNTATDFLTFTLPDQLGTTNINLEDHTVQLEVEKSTDVTRLVPSFTLSEGATVTVADSIQTSNVTAQDFSGLITYVVTAQDGTTTQAWEITASRLFNSATDFLTFSLPEQLDTATIDTVAHTISCQVAYGTDLMNAVPTFTLSLGAKATIRGTPQVSGTTVADLTYSVPYLITAEDSTTQQAWTIHVTTPQKLIGLINGATNFETFGSAVNLSASGQTVAIGAPANETAATAAGQVRVFDTQTDIRQLASSLNGSNASDKLGDAISASADGTIMALGATGDPENQTGYVRVLMLDREENEWKPLGKDILGESTGDRFGISVSLSEDGRFLAVGADQNDGTSGNSDDNRGHVRIYEFRRGNWTQLGKDIDGEATGDRSGWSVSLSADGQTVAIGALSNNGNGTTAGHVRIYQYDSESTEENSWQQVGDDIDGEAAFDRFGYSVSLSGDGRRVAIGARWNDGTDSNAGHVRVFELNEGKWEQLGLDIDGEAKGDNSGWSVSLSADGQVLAVGAFANDAGGDNAGHARIYQYLATWAENGAWQQLGMDLDGIMASDELGSSVSINADGTVVALGAPKNDSTGTDAGQVQLWETGVPLAATDIWAFRVENIIGTAEIDPENHTIMLEVADGTDLKQIVPIFALPYRATATVAGTLQVNGETAQDFSSPVTYTITSGNGSFVQDWTVSMTIPTNSATDILTFSLANQVSEATINASEHTVNITLPFGTDATNLKPTFALSAGASAEAQGLPQTSGVTFLDFSNPVVYTITAANGISWQNWTVEVEVEEVIQSIEDLKAVGEVSLYPNPFTDLLTVKLVNNAIGPIDLILTRLDGSIVMKPITLQKRGETHISKLDLTVLPSGVYILHLKSAQGVAKRRLVKH